MRFNNLKYLAAFFEFITKKIKNYLLSRNEVHNDAQKNKVELLSGF